MRIAINKDRTYKGYYSAIIEDEMTNDVDWNVYEIVDPIGYGKTPLAAVQSLCRKLMVVIRQ